MGHVGHFELTHMFHPSRGTLLDAYLGSWGGLLTIIPLTLVIVRRLLDEEEFLVKNLSGYAEYCNKIRHRLVPFIW
jgi:protein-S-isoprenylcysteine O-methyltransferase Ste14